MNIKQWRLSKNLSPAEAAVALEASVPSIWRWETGSHTPSRKRLERIAELTGGEVQPADWFGAS